MSLERADCEVVITRSGVPAMRDLETGELMHPVVGPLVEAEELYVTPSRLATRLRSGSSEPLVLFDVGLGAGSNAIAAWRLSEAMPAGCRRLTIVSFDRTVAALELALRPEHASAFGLEGHAGAAARALLSEGRHESARTVWRLTLGDLPSVLDQEPAASAEIVFWDPFSPRANPLLWTVQAFTALRRICAETATVHTYSSAVATRAALLLAGFAVGMGAAIGNRSATTVAAVTLSDLSRPLDEGWLARLERDSAPRPVDAPPDAVRRIAALPQFATRLGGR